MLKKISLNIMDENLTDDEQAIYDKLITEINRGMRFQKSSLRLHTIDLLDSFVEILMERGNKK